MIDSNTNYHTDLTFREQHKIKNKAMSSSKNMLVHVEPVQAIPLAEDTPAYECLQTHKLLNTDHRKNSFDEIFGPNDLSPNSSKAGTIKKKFGWGVYWTPGCGLLSYHSMNTDVTVPAGHICCFIDNDNEYIFAKPGMFLYKFQFW